ncbi:WW domain and PTB/PI domain and Pleckstrin homology-like domain-containing protein [Strongyloides ratti]|uniref:WW domain and PTB/PI domain and Pleckstrin homology-like domain-containing protein n=1 Tax=Strongyloides ratti TaxID=34506 RepID=A0A090MYT8_STRRB|nr:WW domain and PTB/PI domain and Pleckstrin homology-like domain-containing protein [Strongyloides ratti]CEF67759.1 WW domain and PTB/PI domain and Pleckstrin homology-like domain-containing protein [Strongyloides ratti]
MATTNNQQNSLYSPKSLLQKSLHNENHKNTKQYFNSQSNKFAAKSSNVTFTQDTKGGHINSIDFNKLKPIRKSRDLEEIVVTDMFFDGRQTQRYREERDQEEIYYIHERPNEIMEKSATINFLTDDRLENNEEIEKQHSERNITKRIYEEEEEMYKKDSRIINERDNYHQSTSHAQHERILNNNLLLDRHPPINYPINNKKESSFGHNTSNVTYKLNNSQNIHNTNQNSYYYQEEEEDHHHQKESVYDIANKGSKETYIPIKQREHSTMSVDYSHKDYNQSRATIESIARNVSENVRIKQIGDTTIMTEHRDPYSFYWQLDQFKKPEEEPPKRPPPVDYVIDEEDLPEPQTYSPQPEEKSMPYESQYSRPLRVEEPVRQLPSGWEKHEDPSGFSYYWHVDTGTIQRDPPPPSPKISHDNKYTQINTETPPPIIQQLPPQQPIIEEHAFKQTTTKRRIEKADESDEEEYDGTKPVRFLVRSLGWTTIQEEDLTADRSSKAVNRCIQELSNGLMDNVVKWGEGRELIMELDDNDMILMNPDTMGIIHSEPISHIRVWGVGRDNGRDFAYVARDPTTRRFLCHVFRCDTPAKTIANTLRDICKRLILTRRSNALETASMVDGNNKRKVFDNRDANISTEELRKIIRCHFIGVTQVPKATGIEILNEAVDRLVTQVRPDRWILADVSIAPSSIDINEVNGQQIATCRVRYLSFLGIGQDIKRCAFIMQTSEESFLCYVFHVEPNAATMAKTIEAACKLRYQKILDAHSGRQYSSLSSYE